VGLFTSRKTTLLTTLATGLDGSITTKPDWLHVPSDGRSNKDHLSGLVWIDLWKKCWAGDHRDTHFAIALEADNEGESLKDFAERSRGVLEAPYPKPASESDSLEPLHGRAPAKGLEHGDRIHVVVRIARGYPLSLASQTGRLKAGILSPDPAAFLQAIGVAKSDPLEAQKILAGDNTRPLIVELLYGNAPFGARLRFSDQLAEWETRVTDRVNAETLQQTLDRIITSSRALFGTT
jgi:hypothetical protein